MPVWLISLAFGGLGKLRAAASYLFGHPLVLAGLAAVLVIVFQHLEITHKSSAIAGLQTKNTALANVAKIDRASNDRLTAAMSEQSAANRELSLASERLQREAKAALAAATARGQRSDALAAQIDATRAHSKPGGACATSKAILDAKGVL